MNIYLDIEKLLAYAQSHLFLDDLDVLYARNLLLDALNLTEYVQYETDTDAVDALTEPSTVVNPLVKYAAENGVAEAKDKTKFAQKLLKLLVKRPGELADIYFDLEAQSPQKAANWLKEYTKHSGGAAEAELKAACGLAELPAPGEDAQPEARVEFLLAYAQAHLLLDEWDVPFVRGLILDELKLTNYTPCPVDTDAVEELSVPDAVLDPVLTLAVESGVIAEADKARFSDKIMNLVMKRPSEITDIFEMQHAKNPAKAFEWLYDYAVKSNYVNLTAVAQNRHWEAKGTKGKLEITVNRSRPEKSNRDVEKAAQDKTAQYPACALCKENEGFSGKGQYRKSLRTVPVALNGEDWFWQYSPYSYFNQHGTAVNASHVPMKVDKSTLLKLLAFTDFMPSYFIGCNAALPGIGGSILAHDHFQGGKPVMPLFKAPVLKRLKCEKHPYIKIELMDWYCPAIRISYTNKENLAAFADLIRLAWEGYSDAAAGIEAATGSIRHNALTPVARKTADGYTFDLILRNNRTTEEFPDGVFGTRPERKPIKSEAVALTESMGWFVLPGRLDAQLARIEKFLTKETRYNAAKLDADLLPFTAKIGRAHV
jgi:UDPglucose--hexose-1-phosphate uridylyltransferase